MREGARVPKGSLPFRTASESGHSAWLYDRACLLRKKHGSVLLGSGGKSEWRPCSTSRLLYMSHAPPLQPPPPPLFFGDPAPGAAGGAAAEGGRQVHQNGAGEQLRGECCGVAVLFPTSWPCCLPKDVPLFLKGGGGRCRYQSRVPRSVRLALGRL